MSMVEGLGVLMLLAEFGLCALGLLRWHGTGRQVSGGLRDNGARVSTASPEAALGSMPARGSTRPKPKLSHGRRIRRDQRDHLVHPSHLAIKKPKLGMMT